MRAVNLLPREHVEQKHERTNVVVLVAALGGAALVLALAAGALLANRSVDRQRQALDTAKAVLAVTPAQKTSAQTSAYRTEILSQREERSLALASAIGKRVAWDRILRHIALVLPGDVWLTSLAGNVPLDSATPDTTTTAAAPTAPSALPAAPTELTIAGDTYSQAGVARLLARLQTVPDLRNVQLQNSQRTPINKQWVVSFTVVADIRQGKGAS
jgi:Tfp pilus assembly protein PilN